MDVNFTRAQNICEANNYRLCTIEEIYSTCSSTECSNDTGEVWSSTTCSAEYDAGRVNGLNACFVTADLSKYFFFLMFFVPHENGFVGFFG